MAVKALYVKMIRLANWQIGRAVNLNKKIDRNTNSLSENIAP